VSAEGCLDLALHRVIETPNTHRLLVTWQSLEDNLVTFRASEGFKTSRVRASPYFAAPPIVTHSTSVAKGSATISDMPDLVCDRISSRHGPREGRHCGHGGREANPAGATTAESHESGPTYCERAILTYGS
jgi:hypothetical protein